MDSEHLAPVATSGKLLGLLVKFQKQPLSARIQGAGYHPVSGFCWISLAEAFRACTKTPPFRPPGTELQQVFSSAHLHRSLYLPKPVLDAKAS